MDYSHLDALNLRLSNERMRYASDSSLIRKVWIEGIEREIAAEREFLGLALEDNVSEDDLLAELFG